MPFFSRLFPFFDLSIIRFSFPWRLQTLSISLEIARTTISLLIAAQKKKPLPATSTPSASKLPSKPLPPAQAVREARSNLAPICEGTGRGGSGRGRGGRGSVNAINRDFENGNYSRFGGGRGGFSVENGDAGDLSERGRESSAQYRGSSHGGRRGEGGIDSDRSQRRFYERRSGTGMGSEMKKDGSGRGNWGTFSDDVQAQLRDFGSFFLLELGFGFGSFLPPPLISHSPTSSSPSLPAGDPTRLRRHAPALEEEETAEDSPCFILPSSAFSSSFPPRRLTPIEIPLDLWSDFCAPEHRSCSIW